MLALGLGLVIPTTCQNDAQSVRVPCHTTATLEDYVVCLQEYIPRGNTDGFTKPSVSIIKSWRHIIDKMVAGQCDRAIHLPPFLQRIYQVQTFTDRENGQRYCVLMEIADHALPLGKVDYGWGTVIVNPNAKRELHIQIPHPQYEPGTARQGMLVFQKSQARSFTLAGTHRNSSKQHSLCQQRFKASDPTHNVQHLFHITTATLHAHYQKRNTPFVVVQFHGKPFYACKDADVYMSYGNNVAPNAGSPLSVLQEHLRQSNPAWKVHVPGGPATCPYHGSDNVQSRLMNGVPHDQVCHTDSVETSERFLHIVQAPGPYRDPTYWIDAINAAFPVQ
jgi:hypothetical protein